MGRRAMIIGIRGKGVYIGGIGDFNRLVTPRKARIYAEQLLRAADATDKAWLLANSTAQQTPPASPKEG